MMTEPNTEEMNNLISHYLFTNFNFSLETCSAIAHRAKLVTVAKKDRYQVSEISQDRMVMILEGHAKLIEMDDFGNDHFKELFHSGEVFDTSTTASRNATYLAPLTHNLKVAILSEDDFEYILQSHREVSNELGLLRKERISKLHRRLNYLICRDVEEKMLIFLQELALMDGRVNGGSIVVQNYLTHNDIAEIINMSRQTVTALLNKLRAEGKIAYSRRELVLKDKGFSNILTAA